MPKEGAKYADQDTKRAWYANLFGNRFCLRPETIYNWAAKHNISLLDLVGKVELYDFLLAVLNDQALDCN